jgi:hypothetical protein
MSNSLQGFKSRIEDVREEILRKRRAGKLPGDTTSILKQWWQQHSKWPPHGECIVAVMHACKNATSHLLLSATDDACMVWSPSDP